MMREAFMSLIQAPFILLCIFLVVMGVGIDIWDRYFRR